MRSKAQESAAQLSVNAAGCRSQPTTGRRLGTSAGVGGEEFGSSVSLVDPALGAESARPEVGLDLLSQLGPLFETGTLPELAPGPGRRAPQLSYRARNMALNAATLALRRRRSHGFS